MTLQNQHWGLCNNTPFFLIHLPQRSTLDTPSGDDYTRLKLERGSTSGTNVTTYYEVIELLIGYYLNKNYPAGYAVGYGVGYP